MQVVAQILPDTRQLVEHIDAGTLQHFALSNSGELEQLWGLVRPKVENWEGVPEGGGVAKT